jgi:hypothetical protein
MAEFYEAKLQRSLDRIVGIAGPAAVIAHRRSPWRPDRIRRNIVAVGGAGRWINVG